MRRSPLRNGILIVLTSCAIVIFVLVSELSRVSQEGLDSAIVQDSGLQGSYEVALVAEVGDVAPTIAREHVMDVARELDLTVWGEWVDLPPVRSECPPYEQLGEQSLRVLWKEPGRVFPLPFGQTGDVDATWCIEGQPIPASALYLPEANDRAVFGDRLYVHPDYERLVLLSTTGPVVQGFVVVTGVMEDWTDAIRQAMSGAFSEAATRIGLPPESLFTVGRLDQDSLGIREASQGVATTYGLIGWGVLSLGGVAVISVQTLVVRQRAWFYGLTRSMGMSRRRVASMFALDTSIIILGALTLSALMLILGSGSISTFARTAFGVEARVLSSSAAIRVIAGMAVVLAVAIGAAVVTAGRRDPLESLEAPRD